MQGRGLMFGLLGFTLPGPLPLEVGQFNARDGVQGERQVKEGKVGICQRVGQRADPALSHCRLT